MRSLTVAVAATLSVLSATLPALPAHASTADDYEEQVVIVTNDHRTDRGLRRLQRDTCLERFAQRHAERMAQEQRISHQDLSTILGRCDLTAVGENVASGYAQGRAVVNQGWMRSEGHRSNILTPRFRVVAVGAARSGTGTWYTAQVLGAR